MKLEWEAGDIKPGRVVGRPERGERWLIGYIVEMEGNVYCVISYNADGRIAKRGTKQDIADHLNKSKEFPAELL